MTQGAGRKNQCIALMVLVLVGIWFSVKGFAVDEQLMPGTMEDGSDIWSIHSIPDNT